MERRRSLGSVSDRQASDFVNGVPIRWPLVGRSDDLETITESLLGLQAAVMIAGSAGIGKTRLAHEALTVMEAKGYATKWVMASAEARTMTFGALAPWLSKEASAEAQHPLDVARVFRNELFEAHGDRVVLAIDDAHLLDGPSSVMIQQMAATRSAKVLLTVRSDTGAPSTLRSLWKDDTALRVDLSPLNERQTDRLLALALGGPVESTLTVRLWRESEGNPLWLRELVLDGARSGRIHRSSGSWGILPGPFGRTGPRLSELIGARLATLGDSQTGYLEVIALGEPLPLVVARALIPEGELAALNQAGMLAVENHGDRSSVRLGHPLYGEAIRAGLSPLRSADLWRDLAVALESSSPADTTDVRRRVLWRLEAGLPVPSSMLEHAAAVAWRQSDPVQAERFARKALAQGHREASVVLAEALASLGRWRETAEVMSTVDTATVTVDHQCRLLRLRMWQCLFLGHIGTAEETMAEVESLATDATLRDSARALRAVVAFYGGNTERGVNWSEELSAREGLNEQARRLASSALANALAFSGRGDYAVEVATAELTRLGVGETLAFAPHQLMWGFFFGLWRSGRFAEAEPAVNSYYQASIDLCDPSLTPIALSVLGIHLCQVGRIAESRRILAEAVEGLARSDPLHYQAIIAAYLAIAAASGGDLGVVTR